MSFTFLKEEIETITLFASAPVYFTIVGILQSKNLKFLEKLKNKKDTIEEKKFLLKRLKKMKFLTPVYMLIGAFFHILIYLFFGMIDFRYGYLISIGIMYFIYTLIALINFYLKGAGILKDIGNFNGLPGN